jgi:hypothetical protein
MISDGSDEGTSDGLMLGSMPMTYIDSFRNQQHILSLIERSHHPPHGHVATADVLFDGHSVFLIYVDIGSSIGFIRMWSRFTTTTTNAAAPPPSTMQTNGVRWCNIINAVAF